MPASLEHQERMLKHLEPAELIAEYVAAFIACNKLNEPPDISFASGWYTFKSSGLYPRKYRRHAVEQMRDRLRERAATDNPGVTQEVG